MATKNTIFRWGLSLLIAAHFTALFLNNLPWGPFIEKLWPYYGWYPNMTGQAQVWGMYSRPNHEDTRFAITVKRPDGSKDAPFGQSDRWDPRLLYLVESLFIQNQGPDLASAFMKNIRGRYPDKTPIEIQIAKHSRPIDSPARGTPDPSFAFVREFKAVLP